MSDLHLFKFCTKREFFFISKYLSRAQFTLGDVLDPGILVIKKTDKILSLMLSILGDNDNK